MRRGQLTVLSTRSFSARSHSSLLTLLAFFIVASRVDFTWHFALLAIPALLFLVSLVSGYRLFRRPYEGVREREP